MKKQEFNVLKDYLLDSITTLRNEVAKASNQVTTMTQWFRAIGDFEEQECRQVIDDWFTGKLPMPKYHEFHFIVLIIRTEVEKRRSKKQEQERVAGYRQKIHHEEWPSMLSEVFPCESLLKRAPSEPTAEDINKNRQAYGGSQ